MEMWKAGGEDQSRTQPLQFMMVIQLKGLQMATQWSMAMDAIHILYIAL